MESSGERNRIHVSESTAELIKQAGKEHWLSQRKEQVHCKGKGLLTTFWCQPRAESNKSSEPSLVEHDLQASDCLLQHESLPKLDEWDVADPVTDSVFQSIGGENQRTTAATLKSFVEPEKYGTSMMRDESLQRLVEWNVELFTAMLREIVVRRNTDATNNRDPAESYLSKNAPPGCSTDTELFSYSGISTAEKELAEFISSVADMHETKGRGNFEHCSHAVMSCKNLLDRLWGQDRAKHGGILLDPLSRFAIMFCQLVKEQCALSFATSGDRVSGHTTLMQMLRVSRFEGLCACLLASKADEEHFRLIVSRTEASNITASPSTSTSNALDRQNAILLGLIVQASDASHTMQHFSVYKKWSNHLLAKAYEAYQRGEIANNPLETWYKAELLLFDDYALPLARQLRDCGAFGTSCDGYLNYAKENRLEWVTTGRHIVYQAAKLL